MIKVKVKNMYRGGEVKLHTFLISVLGGGEKSASQSGRLTSKKGNCSFHSVGG